MNRQERRRQARTNPDGGAQRVARGFALLQQGDAAGAERWFREVLREFPGQTDAMRLLGEALINRGRFSEAIALLERLPGLQPDGFAGYYVLGNAYRLNGQAAAAIKHYQKALALHPGFAGTHHGLGLALRRAEREREAAWHLAEATRLQPGWAPGWRDLGLALAVLGDIAGAEAALKCAVALAPGLGDAQRHLAAIRHDAPGADELAALAASAVDPRVAVDERIDLGFTLGRLAERRGEHAAAFQHYAAANALLRMVLKNQGRTFDREQLRRDVNRLCEVFTPEVLAGLNPGDQSEAPVFIVGMPRAGSSLVEQIAASHSLVFGAGEQFGIGEIASRIGWAPGQLWTTERLRVEAAGYLAGLRANSGNAVRIIDKMPDNIFQLGLIAALFPRARVIFCERDIRDVAISCFFQHFAQPYGFDTDLGDCAFRARELARLTAHWRAVLKSQWMDLSYEALLAAPDAEFRRLIGFLGLEWEPGCLNFHETRRHVRTASWAQVRRPLYRNAVGRWRNYASQLEGIEF